MISVSGSDEQDDAPRGEVVHPRNRGKADSIGSGPSEADALLSSGSKPGSRAAPVGATLTGNTRTTRLLLIEDDRLLSDALSRLLEEAGFTVYVTAFGEDAIDLARAYRFDVVLLDLSLPDMSGHLVLQKLRIARPEAPVIILSGETALATKLEGFQEGADDYVTKPFHRDELLARIHAVLRRSRAAAPSKLILGPLVLDLSARRALVDAEPIALTAKEYACLEFLAMRRGMTVTKEMFLAHLYGGRDEPEMKIIDVFICKLRRKLAEAGSPPLIETVWGRGYTIANEG
jgi:two-component system, cell cycle response regulator CtrA